MCIRDRRIPKGMGYADDATAHPYLRATDMKNETILDDDIHYLDEEVYELSLIHISEVIRVSFVKGVTEKIGDTAWKGKADTALSADAVPALKLYFAAFIFMDLQYICLLYTSSSSRIVSFFISVALRYG